MANNSHSIAFPELIIPIISSLSQIKKSLYVTLLYFSFLVTVLSAQKVIREFNPKTPRPRRINPRETKEIRTNSHKNRRMPRICK